jgi:hypothetical protein
MISMAKEQPEGSAPVLGEAGAVVIGLPGRLAIALDVGVAAGVLAVAIGVGVAVGTKPGPGINYGVVCWIAGLRPACACCDPAVEDARDP